MLHRILAGVLSILLAITPAMPSYAASQTAAAVADQLVVNFLDVGQGDATVIQCGGQTMMIDGGTAKQSSYIYSWLKSQGITYIDYMIGTHSDADHVGGLSGALQIAKVGTAFCSSTTGDSDAFNSWVKYLTVQGKTITVPTAGTTFTLGSATVQILGPVANHEGDNDNSIVTKVTLGSTSFLFAGDAEGVEEFELINAGVDLGSTVLKVGHHGSDSSSTVSFLQKVHPQYAVISVGANNSYGHPTTGVLNRLSSMGISFYRTDLQGTITAISNGAAVAFTTQKATTAAALMTAGTVATTAATSSYGTAAKASVAGATAAAVSSAAGTTATASTGSYILNTRSKVFHYPSCGSVKKMSEKNKKPVSDMTRDQIIAQGYKSCGNCHP